MPVHSTLVKPTLAPGQVLNGVMVHGIFKEKPIFIRPVEEICDVGISSTKRSLETSNEDEDRVETPKAKKIIVDADDDDSTQTLGHSSSVAPSCTNNTALKDDPTSSQVTEKTEPSHPFDYCNVNDNVFEALPSVIFQETSPRV